MTSERERNKEGGRGCMEEEKVRCLPTKEKRGKQMGEGGDKWGQKNNNRRLGSKQGRHTQLHKGTHTHTQISPHFAIKLAN